MKLTLRSTICERYRGKTMYNIIKSLNYNARRDTVIIIALISILAFPFFALFLVGQIDGGGLDEMTGAVYFIGQLGENFIVAMFVILVVACRICGSDAADKTINYEFLSGHNRASIYWARIAAGILWSVLITMLLFYLPLVVFSAVNGWGQEVDVRDAVIRLCLALLPAMRLSAFLMMLTMILRSAGRGIAMGYGAIMVMVIVTSILGDVMNLDLTWQFAFTNVMSLLTLSNSRNIVVDGETVVRYESSLSTGMVAGTIIASVVVSLIYTYFAYVLFKKKDRD